MENIKEIYESNREYIRRDSERRSSSRNKLTGFNSLSKQGSEEQSDVEPLELIDEHIPDIDNQLDTIVEDLHEDISLTGMLDSEGIIDEIDSEGIDLTLTDLESRRDELKKHIKSKTKKNKKYKLSKLCDSFKEESPGNLFYTCLLLQAKGEIAMTQKSIMDCDDISLS